VESSVLSATGRPTYQSYVVGLDGQTGAVKFRTPLPASTSYSDVGSRVSHSINGPYPTAPVVGLDGEAYVAFGEDHKDWRAHKYQFPYEQCGIWPLYWDECPPWESHDASGLGTFSRSNFLKLMKVAPNGGATIQTLWASSTGGEDSPGRVYSRDMPSDIGGLTIDEDGAVLIQTGHYKRRWVMDSVDEINYEDQCPGSPKSDGWCYHIAEDETTRQLTRVHTGGVSTRTLPPDDGSTYMGSNTLTLVGDDHTAFLQYATTIEAIDTRTLNTKWTIASDCCETLTAIRDGGVAIANIDSGMRSVTTDSGGPTVTALGPVTQYEAEQPLLGVWFGNLSPGGQLSSKMGAPLNPSLFSTQVGTGGRNRASRPDLLLFTDPDEAARKALDFVEPITISSGIEWGGKLCKGEDNFYRWTRFVDGNGDSVDVNGLASCEPHGITWGHFHSHTLIGGGDLSSDDHVIANSLPSQTFYLLTRAPYTPESAQIMQRIRYRNVPPRPAGSNMCVWNAGAWIPYVAGAVCSSHLH
jgi:hypothetical protein